MSASDSRRVSGGAAALPPPSPGLELTFGEFRQRITAEGFSPSMAAMQSMYEALPLLAVLRNRVHAHRCDMGQEPAMVFQAGVEK